MPELKPCPFCGGVAELREVHAYLTEGWRVQCESCKNCTMPTWIDQPLMNGTGSPDESTRYTSDQAAQIAAEKWNRRINT